MSHLYQMSLTCVIGHQMCHRRLPTTDFQLCREGRGGRGGQKVLSKPSADSFAVARRQKTMNKSRATWLLIGRWNNSEENKKTVKKILIFFTVFPIDQSEAEMQIVSRVSRHDVICCHF
jgi:hypothetical protein